MNMVDLQLIYAKPRRTLTLVSQSACTLASSLHHLCLEAKGACLDAEQLHLKLKRRVRRYLPHAFGPVRQLRWYNQLALPPNPHASHALA